MVCLKVFTIWFMSNLKSFNAANNKSVATEIEKINAVFHKQGNGLCPDWPREMGVD